MAVGLPAKTTYADGDVFSASDINDTNGTLNLVGQTTNFYAAKNKIINGDFGVNQRNFSSSTTDNVFLFDRWRHTFVGGSVTSTAQTFTPGNTIAGYEPKNYLQTVTASQTTSTFAVIYYNGIEDVRTLAGQTATISFWAKAASGTPSVGIEVEQSFGSGGSSAVSTVVGAKTLSTSWTRYTSTVVIPSISGKTIGTNSGVYLYLWLSAGASTGTGPRASNIGAQNATFQFWGVQIEAGSAATAFQTATGTIQGELAACQRYFNRLINKKSVYFGVGACTSTTFAQFAIPYPTMRTTPALTVSAVTDFLLTIAAGSGAGAISAISLNSASNESVAKIEVTCASGLVSGNATTLLSQNTNATFDLSAEL
jgi:hypothetical protein